MAQFEGKLASWNSEKGFGVIKPKLEAKYIFVHIRDLRCTFKAPLIGDTIFYDILQGNEGKSRTFNEYVNGAKYRKSKNCATLGIVTIISGIPFILPVYIIGITYYPFSIYSIANFACFLTYLSDTKEKQKTKLADTRINAAHAGAHWRLARG
jgi:cold shock CspA family protein